MRKDARAAARLLKTVGNENRLMILCSLVESEQSVSQLDQPLALSQPALSQHLAVLRREKLMETRRESQTIYYSLSSDEASVLIQLLCQTYCA
jgi:DNA-binding transcriptional ArsR family regulator